MHLQAKYSKTKLQNKTPLGQLFLPPLAGVVLLLDLGGERGWWGRLVSVLTTIEIDLNILGNVGSTLVICLHFLQSLFVIILADILHKIPDISGEDPGCDMFVDDLANLDL